MTPDEQIAARDREMDLLLLAEHIRVHLHTWTMPADFGINYGFHRKSGEFVKCYMSDGEILQVVLEWKPSPDFDNGEDFPEEVRQYARMLWNDVGAFMRDRCTFVLSGSMDDSTG